MKSKSAAGAAKKASDKGSKAAAPATVDPATGIRIDKVKAAVVDRYLEGLGLPTTGPIGDRLQRLAAHINDRQKDPAKRAKCDECGGTSDARFRSCCYCGGDEQTGKAAEKEEAEAFKDLRAAAGPASKAAPKSTAIVPAKPAPLATEGSVEEHHESVLRIRKLHEDAIGNVYDIGVTLRDNFERKLYTRVRAPGSGDPVYESWTAMVATELEGICTVQYSYTLMAVVRAFPRELVLRHGPKKLNLLLRVQDPDMQREIEGKLNEGMTTKQLQAKIVEAVGEGATRPPTEGGAGFGGVPNRAGAPVKAPPPSPPPSEPVSKAALTDQDFEEIAGDGLDSLPEPPSNKKGKKGEAAAPAQPPAKEKAPSAPPANPGVTTTFIVGTIKTDVLARPTKKGAPPKPCKRIGEDPFWEIELPNGAVLVQKLIVKKNGAWQVQTTVKAAK